MSERAATGDGRSDDTRAETVRVLAIFEDREQIAADLHDTVIQRLFATALALQGVLAVLPTSDATVQIEAAVAEMDTTIAEIRSTIFALRAGPT